MFHKSPLQMFIITLLIFSLVLSSSAVPTTRRFFPKKEKSSIQTSPEKLEIAPELLRNREDVHDVAEEEGRMDLESDDYPGTGANNRHDPKTPGRA